MKRILCTGLLLACASIAHATETYTEAGTLGAGVGLAQPLTPSLGARLEVTGLGYSRSFSAGSLNYDAHLRLVNAGTYVDYFPFQGAGFHLSAGVIFNADRLNGTAKSNNGTYTLNGTTYPALGQSVDARVKEPVAMPFLGFGFGHSPAGKGWGAFSDFGVAYGRPRVDLTATPLLTAMAGQDQIDAEKHNLQSKVDRYRFYPVIQVGISYRF